MQAALNLLREERRAVLDVHRQILADDALKGDDARHWRQLAAQALAEERELTAAISLLERVVDGRLVEVGGEAPVAALGAWAETPARRLVRPEGRA